MELRIQNLIDEASCYTTIRELRWGISTPKCPHCKGMDIIKRGMDDTNQYRQRYECKSCQVRFDDLTGTVFAGHHQPIKVWIIFLYFLGLNLSTNQIAKELSLNKDDAQYMAEILRSKVVDNKPVVVLDKEVELDEMYVVAGHKGNSAIVKKKIDYPVSVD